MDTSLTINLICISSIFVHLLPAGSMTGNQHPYSSRIDHSIIDIPFFLGFVREGEKKKFEINHG